MPWGIKYSTVWVNKFRLLCRVSFWGQCLRFVLTPRVFFIIDYFPYILWYSNSLLRCSNGATEPPLNCLPPKSPFISLKNILRLELPTYFASNKVSSFGKNFRALCLWTTPLPLGKSLIHCSGAGGEDGGPLLSEWHSCFIINKVLHEGTSLWSSQLASTSTESSPCKWGGARASELCILNLPSLEGFCPMSGDWVEEGSSQPLSHISRNLASVTQSWVNKKCQCPATS